MKYALLILLCLFFSNCIFWDSGPSRKKIMIVMGADFNKLGEAINNNEQEDAVALTQKLKKFIASRDYLGYREKLELDAQTRYRIMEKKLNALAEIKSLADMYSAYNSARVSCISCHKKMNPWQRLDSYEKVVTTLTPR